MSERFFTASSHYDNRPEILGNTTFLWDYVHGSTRLRQPPARSWLFVLGIFPFAESFREGHGCTPKSSSGFWHTPNPQPQNRSDLLVGVQWFPTSKRRAGRASIDLYKSLRIQLLQAL